MKISQRKLEIWYARKLLQESDLRKMGVGGDVLDKIKKHRDIRPITAGKVANALGVDITEILEEEGSGVRLEFEKIVAIAKAGQPLPRYSRAMDSLIFREILRVIADCKRKKITTQEAKVCYREIEREYRELDLVYALADDRNRIYVALGGFRAQAMTQSNGLALEMIDRIIPHQESAALDLKHETKGGAEDCTGNASPCKGAAASS